MSTSSTVAAVTPSALPPCVRYIRGRVIHAPQRGVDLQIHEDAFLAIDPATGRVHTFHEQIQADDLPHFQASPSDSSEDSGVLVLAPHEFIMPGFVDTHVHAPQFQYIGTGMDLPLMQWLTTYTFPVEASFADLQVATAWYSKLLDVMLSEGITTAQYFATIHLAATQKLVELIAARGQRGLVGLVSMDRHAPPSYVAPSTEQALQDAEAFILSTRALRNELVLPVITPRFIPTCSPALLRGLGALAARYEVHIQSHIAESHDEEAFVEALHPGQRDTELFRAAGLLTERSCMAHAVHLTDDELDVCAETGTSLAHCPLSNFFFANGLLNVPQCWAKRVHVGLGTDLAGGYSPSMLRAMQTAVVSSKALEMTAVAVEPSSAGPAPSSASAPTATGQATSPVLDYKDAFWLATMGGAQALGLEQDTGSFAVGKCLDAILVDAVTPQNLTLSGLEPAREVLQKVLHNGDSRNFKTVFVKGRAVHHRATPVYS